ncbi:ABC transporter ATP-binding protein [Streptomyces sp. NPDC054864]
MSFLVMRQVSVAYGGAPVLRGVDLEVPAGGVTGLVGGSGCGKSTLGRAAVSLAPLTGGEILVAGRPIARRPGRGPVQLVFQDPYASLDPRMTVGAAVAEALPRGGGAPRGRKDRLMEAARYLDLVGLDPDRARYCPDALSGGQRQRVALARALAARPGVLIADEITSSLDVSVQGAVLNLLRRLQGDLGFALLFISHDLAVVRYLADHVAMMDAGRIVEHGRTDDVLERPEHPTTRRLMACVPTLPGYVPRGGSPPAAPEHGGGSALPSQATATTARRLVPPGAELGTPAWEETP